MNSKWFLLLLLVVFALLVVGCGDSGLPKQPGEYDIQPKSITYDGDEYSFYWVDKDKSLRRASVAYLKMMQDTRTYLEMRGSEPIMHLTPEEPISVQGEDRDGNYSSPWLPFWAGTMVGRGSGPGPVIVNQPYAGSPQTSSNTSTYHYPPSSSFGRGDTLQGSVTNNQPSAPNYGKVKPAPHAVSGQSGGTGGGTAVTGKTGGTAGGQSGGTGTGTAASQKGGFKSGSSSYSSTGRTSSSKVGGGSGTSTGAKSSTGSSGTRSSGARSSSGGRGGGK